MYAHRQYVRSSQRGFTLVELIITMAVAAILATVALPSFFNSVQSNTQIARINDFLSHLHFARSEAVKRHTSVTLCKSTNSQAATPSCSQDASVNWENGWIVFIDIDNDSTRDSGELLLRVGEPIADRTLRATSTFSNSLTFNSKGLNTATTAGLFSLCDDRGASEARAIAISATGHAAATKTQLNGGALSCPSS